MEPRANVGSAVIPAAGYTVPRFPLWWRQTHDLSTMRVQHQRKIPRSSARRLRDCRAAGAAGRRAVPGSLPAAGHAGLTLSELSFTFARYFSASDRTRTMSPSDAAWQQLISALHASGRKAAL